MAGEWVESNIPQDGSDADGISGKILAGKILNDMSNFGSGLKSKFSSTYRKTDDNIIIPVDTKTLLGDDFSTLYQSVDTKSYSASDGTTLSGIVGKGSYETEMHSGMCSVNNQMSYDLLVDREKAMYEVTLLSKLYASKYSADGAQNEILTNEYADKMSQYRAYCESHNLDWVDICNGVNIELQTECADYLALNRQILGNQGIFDADSSRIVTNRAHGLLLQCVPEGYSDALTTSAELRCPGMSYEDTLDTSSHYTSFLMRVKDAFVEKWNAIKDHIPHPIRALKQSFFVATEELGKLTDESVARADQYRQETEEAAAEMIDKTNELVENVKDSTQEKLDKLEEEGLFMSDDTSSPESESQVDTELQ